MHILGPGRAAGGAALLGLLSLFAFDAHAQGLTVTRVASFTSIQAPEGVWIDRHNNKFVSLATTGEIVKISREGVQSTVAVLPLGGQPPYTFCFGFPAIIGNAYGDDRGNLFVGVHSCDAASSGLWKVAIGTGEMTMVASAPSNAELNGTIVNGDTVLVTDSLYDVVWQAPANGTGAPLTVWKSDPLLQAPPGPFPGPNGIAIFHDTAYVAVSATFQIVKMPILADGSAGPASLHAQLSMGCDDFSFDVDGSIYCTTDPFESVTKITQAGVETVLLGPADGLDGPTATYWGFGEEARTMYITNSANLFFPSTGNGASLLKVDLGVRGYHFPQPHDDDNEGQGEGEGEN
jgi:hypothetical protein